LSRAGPLGSLGLLFTPQAMIVAQTVLITPIVAALTRQTVEDLWTEYRDELDPAATKAIEDVIRTIAGRGIKVVMSTHDLGEARRLAGEIVLMHRGRVIESGPAEAFFADPRTEEARRFVRGELLV